MSKKTLFAATLMAAFFVYAEEMSVFDSATISNVDSYSDGSSSQTNKISLGSLKSEVDALQESVEGIRSVIDSINENNNKLNLKILDLENSATGFSDTNGTDQIEELRALIIQNKKEQDEKIDRILSMLNGSSSVSSTKSKSVSEPVSIENSGDNSDLDSKNLREVLSEADKAFQSKNYTRAKIGYAKCADNKHKPAYSNFMLGEIEYFSKNYADAISYYQKSVNLHDKGDYMPKLLYHTAISLDKVGNTSDANKFYAALKQAYPNSKEAKASPNRK